MDIERAEYEDDIRGWERRAPWYRRISARTGLQGKLVLSFMFLLVVTLTASSLQFIGEGREITEEVLAGKAMTIAATVAVAAEDALARGDAAALDAVGRKLLENKDIAGVAFFHRTGERASYAWRDDDDASGRRAQSLRNPREHPNAIGKIFHHADDTLGRQLQVTVPVRQWQPGGGGAGPARVVGFVTVSLSHALPAPLIGQSRAVVILIGAFSALVSLPLVYMLVHRIFHPIRALVDATNRIAAGDLGAEVAIHRPDVIGTLARSFNEMVKKVRRQQGELAAANGKLTAANAQLEQINGQLAIANVQLAMANEQLAEANHDLEEKVRQRTAQVETANKRLRSEISEKEDFLRAVSHDLNAPLRNIAGMASMLLHKHGEKFDPDVVHRLERIQKNVEVETDLIAELLELSRIKTRRLKAEPVNLNDLVQDLAEVLGEDLRSKQIKLSIDTSLPVVEAERARMRQVFQNLIDNAIKYMGDGGVQESGARSQASGDPSLTPDSRPLTPVKEIHVGCTVRHDEAEFYVRDTGIGIEPDDLDKVFFVFRRGKSPTVQAVAGKGIGLASVKSIVETYEGTIWVESAPGKGTTFRFTINGKHVPDSRKLLGAPRGRAA